MQRQTDKNASFIKISWINYAFLSIHYLTWVIQLSGRTGHVFKFLSNILPFLHSCIIWKAFLFLFFFFIQNLFYWRQGGSLKPHIYCRCLFVVLRVIGWQQYVEVQNNISPLSLFKQKSTYTERAFLWPSDNLITLNIEALNSFLHTS